jgi:hypothetical protein
LVQDVDGSLLQLRRNFHLSYASRVDHVLPNRLRTQFAAGAGPSGNVPTGARRNFGIYVLAGLAVALVATNLLTLGNAGFHAKAYAFIESIARAAGMESVLSSSPTELNRQAIEVAARHSAEIATRQQRATVLALAANSLALADATGALIKEHKALRQTHLALAQTSKAVARRVAIRTAGGATRSVSTLAGKALPYLGIASVLALTAYDVADACQTLKDANELEIAAGALQGNEEGKICGLQVPSIDQVSAWAGGLWH